ncbi:MAG TPA: AAA family ATPase [Blastocatellia bacterium]|nr:AAA family ATPase [Blastocatellia bacterium]
MMQLITEKMALPSRRQRPQRKRLVDLVQNGIGDYNSTVLCGRAGAGKTALATEVAKNCGRKVAWYKVDSSDTDHRFFLRYLLTSISARLPKPGILKTIKFAESAHLEEMETVAEMLVFQLIECSTEPLLIAIDDLHLVYDASWMVSFFGRLLPLLPTNVHILLAGRSLPPAPLWRMRSKQTLNVIDERLLAFTENEAAELFAHLRLPIHLADSALEATRGRAQRFESLAMDLVRVAADSSAA